MLHDVGVAPERINESTLLMFSATVPAAGARTLELTSGTTVLAKLTKPSPTPTVKLVVPRHGLKLAHACLTLRWRARGARGVGLGATVQYLASAKQGWQTVAADLPESSYKLRLAVFKKARRVRLRVIVSDGFSDAVVTSKPIALNRG
jgi:hypothetical protein